MLDREIPDWLPEIKNLGFEIERVKDRKAYVNSIYASGGEMVLTDLLKLIRDKDY